LRIPQVCHHNRTNHCCKSQSNKQVFFHCELFDTGSKLRLCPYYPVTGAKAVAQRMHLAGERQTSDNLNPDSLLRLALVMYNCTENCQRQSGPYTRWQVVYALHACSFAPQLRGKCSPMHHIVSAFRLVEAQNNSASIRKLLAMGYNPSGTPDRVSCRLHFCQVEAQVNYTSIRITLVVECTCLSFSTI
jgi:hypothetical protein